MAPAAGHIQSGSSGIVLLMCCLTSIFHSNRLAAVHSALEYLEHALAVTCWLQADVDSALQPSSFCKKKLHLRAFDEHLLYMHNVAHCTRLVCSRPQHDCQTTALSVQFLHAVSGH
jgi:hypothetical protein